MSIWLNPERVVFDGDEFDQVRSVRIERRTEPEITVADTATSPPVLPNPAWVSTEIIITREWTTALDTNPVPGTLGLFEFEAARGRSDAQRVTLGSRAVVASTTVVLTRSGQAVQTIRLFAVSLIGELDPFGVTS